MSDESDSVDNVMEGGKKSNGHKHECKCPICKNMMYKSLKKKSKSKKGGAVSDSDSSSDSDSDSDNITTGGKKKSNGHKHECKCPICKNMSKNKKGGQPEPDKE